MQFYLNHQRIVIACSNQSKKQAIELNESRKNAGDAAAARAMTTAAARVCMGDAFY